MSLNTYRAKRNFNLSPEPKAGKKNSLNRIFVIQEHWASHHHFDFRLEAFHTLKSWAVPKGVPMQKGVKRLAVEVEDHPLSYANFEGNIPKGQYGGGRVKIWDKGTWSSPKKLREQFKKGHLEFDLKGKKLKGRWLLLRTNALSGEKNQWLLMKGTDKNKIKQIDKKNKNPWPGVVAPQLATLVAKVPQGTQWLHETKYDGYRTLVHIRQNQIRFFTRNGHDWSDRYEFLKPAFKKLNLKNAIIDGEIVVFDKKNISNFLSLQKALKENLGDKLSFIAFDLLYLNDHDLRSDSLETRKIELKKILKQKNSQIILSEHRRGQGNEIFAQACKQGFEGIVSKNKNLSYLSGRHRGWLKIKCSSRQEFVIGGFTDPAGTRSNFGALLLGVFEEKQFRYIGRVGTGFNSDTLQDIYQRLKKIESKRSYFQLKKPKHSRSIHWVKPLLIAEVEFKGWTDEGILRQASFQGLRTDKAPQSVKLEKPKDKSQALASRFIISHPQRVIYPLDNITKLDVANYYQTVAPWLLQFSANHPLALIRCPDQSGEQCFYQKHVQNDLGPSLLESKVKDQKFNYIHSVTGVLQLVQWGVLEFHTWQCNAKNPLHPNQIVFDIDPDENMPWQIVIDTAFLFKKILKQLALKSFVKVTGGKGLHVHVPIEPKNSWEDVKAYARAICAEMQSRHPDLYTINPLKKMRQNKLFLDYLRNGFGSTAIAPYSLRAKDHPTVALPIQWKELKTISGANVFTLQKALRKIAITRSDPWSKYEQCHQVIRFKM